MWTVECFSTDRFHAFPLAARRHAKSLAVRLDPAQTAVSCFADDIDDHHDQQKSSKNDAEQQLRRDEFLKKVDIQRNRCGDSPPHPLRDSTELHLQGPTLPRLFRCKSVAER